MSQSFDRDSAALNRLTPKELECLRLVAMRHSSKEIARELGISKASVDTYCNRARAKLGVSSRFAAARLALGADLGSAVESAALDSAAAAVVAPVRWLPPLAEIGPLQRLALMLGGAAVLAAGFGLLMNGLMMLTQLSSAVR